MVLYVVWAFHSVAPGVQGLGLLCELGGSCSGPLYLAQTFRGTISTGALMLDSSTMPLGIKSGMKGWSEAHLVVFPYQNEIQPEVPLILKGREHRLHLHMG